MYLVKDLYERHAQTLGLELTNGKTCLNKPVRVPEAQRPGLSLSGYLRNHAGRRVLIFGKIEIEYLRDLDPDVRMARLEAIITDQYSCHHQLRTITRPPKELRGISERHGVPLFRTNLSTMNLLSKLTLLFTEDFAPSISCHGTLVEVFGVGCAYSRRFFRWEKRGCPSIN